LPSTSMLVESTSKTATATISRIVRDQGEAHSPPQAETTTASAAPIAGRPSGPSASHPAQVDVTLPATPTIGGRELADGMSQTQRRPRFNRPQRRRHNLRVPTSACRQHRHLPSASRSSRSAKTRRSSDEDNDG
jgi:hypothetical protein